jgi:hypothetical protein
VTDDANTSHRFTLTGQDPTGRNRTIILWREMDLVGDTVVRRVVITLDATMTTATMLTRAQAVEVGQAISAIVTAPFIRELRDSAWINRTTATYHDMNATLSLVWVHCDATTMHTYIRHRGAARDATKLQHWNAYLDTIDLEFRPPAPHTVIDKSASVIPLQNQAKKLLASIVGAGAS